MEPDELLTTLHMQRRPREHDRQQPPGPSTWSHAMPLVAQPGPQTVRAPRATKLRTECAAGGSNDRREHRHPRQPCAHPARPRTRRTSLHPLGLTSNLISGSCPHPRRPPRERRPDIPHPAPFGSNPLSPSRHTGCAAGACCLSTAPGRSGGTTLWRWAGFGFISPFFAAQKIIRGPDGPDGLILYGFEMRPHLKYQHGAFQYKRYEPISHELFTCRSRRARRRRRG